MKYHAKNEKSGRTYCGLKITPEKFVYPLAGFNNHYDKEQKCSKCEHITKVRKILI